MNRSVECDKVFVDSRVEGVQPFSRQAFLVLRADVYSRLPEGVDERRMGAGIGHRVNKDIPDFGIAWIRITFAVLALLHSEYIVP